MKTMKNIKRHFNKDVIKKGMKKAAKEHNTIDDERCINHFQNILFRVLDTTDGVAEIIEGNDLLRDAIDGLAMSLEERVGCNTFNVENVQAIWEISRTDLTRAVTEVITSLLFHLKVDMLLRAMLGNGNQEYDFDIFNSRLGTA
ncbi:hypothetical protein HMPREF0653_01577 [Prevotella disiens JCM 6334 = ATCC 29426]|uniref:Uncharacterized protein n=3 Tax=Prevotella disiens TaxID=28130 RepID=A0A379DZ40_9BACT|nr:hypothetical protein HMPREF0653_01577 [Prevotella disiens JCM 6334 = ATCC 29426]SUB85738.1 Uncharacterised protein [Prevotella disiens]